MSAVYIHVMLLAEWAKKRAATPEGKGVYTHLFRVSGVSYKTVLKLARDGLGTRDHVVAEKLSKATGGECSIEEILYPERFAKKKPHRRSTVPPSAA